MFEELIKKNNKFVSPVKYPLKYCLSDIKIKSLQKYVGDKGYLIKLFISPSINNDVLKEFDELNKNTVRDIHMNSEKWFNKFLSEDDVKELYTQVYCSQSHTLDVILSSNHMTKYVFNNKQYNELEDIIHIIKDVKNLKYYIINVEIQHIGLHIYKEEATHKWIIKNLNIIDTNTEKCHWEKEDIEEKFEENISTIIKKTNEKINKYHSHINNLLDNSAKLQQAFHEVKKLSGKSWENKIHELNELINAQEHFLNL